MPSVLATCRKWCYGNDFYLSLFDQVAVDGRCPPACPRNSNVGVAPACPPLGASQYKGTWDVVYKIARQVCELQYSDLYLWLHELCTVQKKTASPDTCSF